MQISVKEPDFSPITIVIENHYEAKHLLSALRDSKSVSFVGSELQKVLTDAVYG